MKKFLNILGTVTIIGSGVLTLVVMNSSINEINPGLNQNNYKILDENISNLEQIDKEFVLNSLVQKGNNVVINYQLFLDKNLTNGFINLMKNFQLTNTNINDVKRFLFNETKENLSLSIYSINDWRIHVEKSKWYEWILGIWRLDFNHDLIQDICYSAVTLGSLIQIVGDTGIYANVATVVDIVLNIGALILKKIDQGNGVVIRFFGWIIPTKFAGATYKWS